MNENTTYAEILFNLDEVMSAVKPLLTAQSSSQVYISGPFLKPLIDSYLTLIKEGNANPHIFIIVPSITGKDYAGTSLLYYVNMLHVKMKVNSRAVHNIIADKENLFHISYTSRIMGENCLTGAHIKNHLEAAKAISYCLELWNNSLPFQLGG